MAHPYWPLFDLSIRTPKVELRIPDDELIMKSVELSLKGIHDPATMPFGMPWTDAKSPEFERASLQHYWGSRANHKVDDWALNFTVLVDGEVVGAQHCTIEAARSRHDRSVQELPRSAHQLSRGEPAIRTVYLEEAS